MNDDTRHVVPSAPRTLSEKPVPNGGRWFVPDDAPKGKITRGTPIEKLSPEVLHGLSRQYDPRKVIDKINELIDRLNQMSEL